ncbi:MAG: polysaccharide deacetylase family protein [Desulfovibrio sp.]|jgi:peptidoglycan/xylan/chitin deacetylase (PgdA/CDA1 family)|nr:polysaccharide deacetylase family protein [Desulfovibrio sp.]
MIFSLPVLMYHSVSRHPHRLCVAPEVFEDHCRVLAGAGWRGIPLEEAETFFLRKRRLPRKVCLFTFDDGYLDNYVHAEPLLRRYGHRGALFPVLGLLHEGDVLRPAGEDLGANGAPPAPLPNLDARAPVRNGNGLLVSPIVFCSWKEAAAMREKGAMDIAPHSMTHGRVAGDLKFTRLYLPGDRYSFFDVPPYPVPWGFPRFYLDHGLTHPGYTPAPELFDLIRAMVPQTPKEAQAFLSQEKNREAVVGAVNRLPCLGTRESMEEYRARVAAEFAACREQCLARLGFAPVSFCWPWGDYTSVARKEGRKAGFRVFFTTYRGANVPGVAGAVRRIAVRNCSGADLLSLVRGASSALRELPHDLGRILHRFWNAPG